MSGTGFWAAWDLGPGADVGATAGTGAATRTVRYTAADRFAASWAQDRLNPTEEADWPEDQACLDDAPSLDDLPEGSPDEDDVLLGDDDRGLPAPSPSPSWLPWVRLSITLDGDRLGYMIGLPFTGDSETDERLERLAYGWSQIAETLIRSQAPALRSSSLLEAVRALPPATAMKWVAVKGLDGKVAKNAEGKTVTELRQVTGARAIERSSGQFSRDRRVVVGTPFGLAPLWLFGQGRQDSLFRDLERIGRQVVEDKPESLTAPMIEKMARNPAVKPESIRRAHGQALLAVAHRPGVIARHRALWPLTSPDALLDDLGVTGRTGRSQPVATLALAGAFDPPGLIVARSTARPPRRRAAS
ncbi:MAG: hypothetical protein LBK95_19985 [Bifidobacteriaceae bacterium]|jgi:hypothetical protein|nr:hypothetical protein [Bifidobacteriaceae bacterium]